MAHCFASDARSPLRRSKANARNDSPTSRQDGEAAGKVGGAEEIVVNKPSEAAPMPLLDHFHPPLHGPRRWEGFHHAWATFIAAQLNQETLPPDYFAESEISVGPELEIDVAA